MAKKSVKKSSKKNVEPAKPKRVRKVARKFRESARTAILAAFGFLIALVWKDVITEWVNQITALSPVQGKLISAFLVTLIAVIAILIITPSEDEE